MNDPAPTPPVRYGYEYDTKVAVVDDLPAAWAFIFEHTAGIPEPGIEIKPIWHKTEEETEPVTRFEVNITSSRCMIQAWNG